MLSVFLFCTGVVVFSLVWYRSKKKWIKLINDFPGPKTEFLLGNTLDITRDAGVMFKRLRGFCEKYSTYRLWAWYEPTIHIVTPEDAEKILTSNVNIKKGFVYDFFHPWFGTGLLTSTGAKWQKRRKMLTPAFHFSILQKFGEVITENSENFVQNLKKECQVSQTNIVPLIQQNTLSVICETAMGTKLDDKDKKHSEYIAAVNGMGSLITQRLLSPWLYNKYIFDLCPMGWKQYGFLKVLKDFANRVIQDREKNFINEKKEINQNSSTDHSPDDDIGLNKKKRMAMLDLLLKEKIENNNIDNDGIREEVDTFMFEGHDTTAMALCYQFVILASHPDIQEKIVEEIREVKGGDDDKNLTFNDLSNLRYLEMVVKECLRLYPSVGTVSREITEDLQLKSSIAPAGSTAVIHFYDIHRDPRHFPDPEKFDPDRFLPENAKNRHPFAFVPFSAGPRNCIGQKFAMLEMKSVLSHILWNYVLEPVHTRNDLKLLFDIVIRNDGPIYIKFTQRQHSVK